MNPGEVIKKLETFKSTIQTAQDCIALRMEGKAHEITWVRIAENLARVAQDLTKIGEEIKAYK